MVEFNMKLNKQQSKRLIEILHNMATGCHDALSGNWDLCQEGLQAMETAAEEGLLILNAPTPEYGE